MMTNEYKEYNAAKDALAEYTTSYETATAAVEENTRAQGEALAVIESYAGVEGEATEGNQALQDTLAETKIKMDDLAAAYTAAYDAALQSTQGQFQLWDDAAAIVGKAAEDISFDTANINNSIDSQLEYWQEYNASLESLSQQYDNIDGLREMVASFADAGPESQLMLTNMADASKDDLAAMVSNWKDLQAEQDNVATSLAELGTDFPTQMEELQKELETTVDSMDLGTEAAENGRKTIQEYIDAAEEMLPEVEAAYGRLARAASNALTLNVQYNSSVGKTPVDGSHAAGLDYVPYDGYIAELHKGERVQTAEAVAAERSGGSNININLAPVYQNSGTETPAQLETIYAANNEKLKAMLLDVLEDIGIDAGRVAFT
jgi:chromosome segregation ATPase